MDLADEVGSRPWLRGRECLDGGLVINGYGDSSDVVVWLESVEQVEP